MLKTFSLSAIFPAFNEEKNIENTLMDSHTYLNAKFKDFEIIVVDDGSGDMTGNIVKQYAGKYNNIILETHAVNRGYGQALKTGFDSARMEYIFFMDSDGQFDISELDRFTEHIGDTIIVLGYRYNRSDSLIRKINTYLYHLYINAFFGLRVRDIDCAFKLFPRDAYIEVKPIESEGAFFTAELLIKFKRAGYKFIELPVDHYPRKFGNPTGANLRVITKMFVESYKMFKK